MTAVWVGAYTLLGTGALLCLVRVARGPSLLDRVVGTETLLAIITAGLTVYAGLAQDPTAVPVLLVVALLGFLGAVSVGRYVGGMPLHSADDRQDRGAPSATGDTTGGGAPGAGGR